MKLIADVSDALLFHSSFALGRARLFERPRLTANCVNRSLVLVSAPSISVNYLGDCILLITVEITMTFGMMNSGNSRGEARNE